MPDTTAPPSTGPESRSPPTSSATSNTTTTISVPAPFDDQSAADFTRSRVFGVAVALQVTNTIVLALLLAASALPLVRIDSNRRSDDEDEARMFRNSFAGNTALSVGIVLSLVAVVPITVLGAMLVYTHRRKAPNTHALPLGPGSGSKPMASFLARVTAFSIAHQKLLALLILIAAWAQVFICTFTWAFALKKGRDHDENHSNEGNAETGSGFALPMVAAVAGIPNGILAISVYITTRCHVRSLQTSVNALRHSSEEGVAAQPVSGGSHIQSWGGHGWMEGRVFAASRSAVVLGAFILALLVMSAASPLTWVDDQQYWMFQKSESQYSYYHDDDAEKEADKQNTTMSVGIILSFPLTIWILYLATNLKRSARHRKQHPFCHEDLMGEQSTSGKGSGQAAKDVEQCAARERRLGLMLVAASWMLVLLWIVITAVVTDRAMHITNEAVYDLSWGVFGLIIVAVLALVLAIAAPILWRGLMRLPTGNYAASLCSGHTHRIIHHFQSRREDALGMNGANVNANSNCNGDGAPPPGSAGLGDASGRPASEAVASEGIAMGTRGASDWSLGAGRSETTLI